ncbi:MAG TPA: hypothetical protein ENI94_06540 [Gammaproteobacteria bacterium]|nr:hypothetical protein [Gammaproteobacteria bacterium]
MAGWEEAAARYQSEAQAVLAERGLPTTWAELREPGARQPADRLEGLAVQVVAAAELLAQEVERGRVGRALDRHHDLLAAHEEMDILAHHPEMEETAVTTRRLHRNLRTGILRNQGGDRGRASQSANVTSAQLKAAIDKEIKKNPRHKITAVRDTVAEQFGISRRWVTEKTGSYNPLK